MQQSDNELNILQRKARDWARLVVELHNTKVPASLEGEKRALLNFAKKIKNAIEGVVGTVPELDPLNQLGAIPVIAGVLGVAGAGAAITKWTLDFNKFKAKIEDRNALIASGVPPKAAADITNQAEAPSVIGGVFSDTRKVVTFGALGLGLYIFAKKRGFL